MVPQLVSRCRDLTADLILGVAREAEASLSKHGEQEWQVAATGRA